MVARLAAGVLIVGMLAVAAGKDETAGLRVHAIQHRGWWELQFPDGTIVANELHIPSARTLTVDATLDGAGILWCNDGHLPRFGRRATLRFTMSRGSIVYADALHLREPRAARLTIISDDHFDAWLAHQKQPAAMPATASAARGKDVFLTARCMLCHSVRGIRNAEEPVGPDLTHVATRSTLAAGVLPNRMGDLAGWIVDPDTLKPGSGMPINNIGSADLQSLLAFLQTLR